MTTNKYTKSYLDKELDILSSWSLDKKRSHIRKTFRKWNARTNGLTGDELKYAEERLELCAAAMEIYKKTTLPKKKPSPPVVIVQSKKKPSPPVVIVQSKKKPSPPKKKSPLGIQDPSIDKESSWLQLAMVFVFFIIMFIISNLSYTDYESVYEEPYESVYKEQLKDERDYTSEYERRKRLKELEREFRIKEELIEKEKTKEREVEDLQKKIEKNRKKGDLALEKERQMKQSQAKKPKTLEKPDVFNEPCENFGDFDPDTPANIQKRSKLNMKRIKRSIPIKAIDPFKDVFYKKELYHVYLTANKQLPQQFMGTNNTLNYPKAEINVRFYINENGKPSNIMISSLKELEDQMIYSLREVEPINSKEKLVQNLQIDIIDGVKKFVQSLRFNPARKNNNAVRTCTTLQISIIKIN